MSGVEDDFAIAVPVWRARRLRAHLEAMAIAGDAAYRAGAVRIAPSELAHRAEASRWLGGWDHASAETDPATPKQPTARQLIKITRWQSAAGRLRPAQGALRREILESVAEALLSERPLARGAIVAAHRETVRRCRDAGLPAPKASRYRRWLQLTGRVTDATPTVAAKTSAAS